MALTKAQKQKIITELKEKVAKQKAIVFTDFTGLKVKDLSALRKEMRKHDGELKVVKKTLISSVFKEKKIGVDPKTLKGEIALGFGYQDEIQPFKTLYEFAKDHENLKIIGGLLGKDFLEKEKALALGQLPSKNELLARAVGSIAAPLSGMVNVLQGNLRKLLYIFSQLQTKGQA